MMVISKVKDNRAFIKNSLPMNMPRPVVLVRSKQMRRIV